MTRREQLRIELPIASDFFTKDLPDESRNEIKLIFKSKHYTLPRDILISFSKFFQRVLSNNLHSYELKMPSNEQCFDNLISVFHGNSVVIDRSELSQYYQIIKYLEIDYLKELLLEDINEQFQEYDTFAIMKLAQDNSNDELFKKCLDELESQSFQQMKYHQLSLLSIDLNLFKLTIKCHNQFKGKTKKGLTYKNISDLIKLYCDSNCLPAEQIQELRLELIEVSALSAQEFKEIFMDPILKKISVVRPPRQKIGAEASDIKFKKKIGIFLHNLSLRQSSPQLRTMPSTSNIKQIKLFIQNIYLTKQVEQLQKQTKKLSEQIKQLRPASRTKKSKTIPLDSNFQLLTIDKEQLKQKDKLNQFFEVIDKMNQEFQEKIEEMNQIVCTYQQKMKEKTEKQANQSELSSELSDLSCVIVHQMMTNNTHPFPIPKLPKRIGPKFKRPCSINTITTEDTSSDPSFDSKIFYSEVPTAFRAKSLPILNKFIRPEGFKKIHLVLIYRQSHDQPCIGHRISIFNRGSLLILIRTKQGQEVGGFISSTLLKNQAYVEDENAFIFSIQKKKKFKIASLSIDKAIILNEQSFLNFSNDLKISNNCLTSKSYYRCKNYLSEHSKPDNLENQELGLPSEFYIQNLQIYEMERSEMEMLI